MINLLVVDDNLRDHDRYRAFLEGGGFRLLCCASGAEALRAVEDQVVLFKGVILLWELPPAPNGPDLLAHLRRNCPDLPVIVVSGLLDLSRAARALARGASDFLLKPLERTRLGEAVRTALRGRRQSPLVDALQERMIGTSRAFVDMLESLAPVIAQPNETVLLLGENGSGKEVLARAVHDLGAKDKELWIPVNVASIPATLMEPTLFGHEPGAFTDARTRRLGLFEESGTGTLFLDEIGELSPALQAKLLRVIQERLFRRVGGSQDLRFQARLVCATNRDLVAEEKAGRFRRDLYYRIASHEIHVPPVRQRGDDLWLFLNHFLHKYGPGRKVAWARETRALLSSYPFPGNVRELEDIVKHALLKCAGDEVLPYHLPVEIMQQRQVTAPADTEPATIPWPRFLFDVPQKQAVLEIENTFNREYLPQKLKEAGGNITRAAKTVGLDPKTFRKKWEQAGLGPLSSTE